MSFSLIISNNKNRFKNRFNLIIILFFLLYLFAGFFLINHYQYVTSSDGMSYINIAKLYIDGNLQNAINGYWGPLFSWLMIPFIKVFGTSPLTALYAARFLSIIIGAFTLLGVVLLSFRFDINNWVRGVCFAIMIPFVLSIALGPVQPDLLLACFLTYYLYLIFDPKYKEKPLNGILCGFIGGIAFLTKAYALPFFLLHFIIFNYLNLHQKFSKENMNKILKGFLGGFLVLLLISTPWILTISEKYGELTYGTTGEYNYGVANPNNPFGGHPTLSSQLGFYPPPYPGAISAWEDPSYLPVQSWSPFKSVQQFLYQLSIIWANFNKLIGFYQNFSYFSMLIILIYILLCLKPLKQQNKKILYPIITLLIFPAAYLLIGLEVRYLWICYILLVLMGGQLIYYFLKNLNKKITYKNIAKTLILLIFAYSFIIGPVNDLKGYYDLDKGIYEQSLQIQSYHIQGKLASNGNAENGNYRKMLQISYFIGAEYYGFARPDMTDEELYNNLKKYDIDYYFVWGDSNQNIPLLSQFKEISNGRILGLRVFAIKNPI